MYIFKENKEVCKQIIIDMHIAYLIMWKSWFLKMTSLVAIIR